MWLGAVVNQEGKIVTHPLDKEVIGDFREPLSSLLQADRSYMEYCLTQVTKIAGEMKRRRRRRKKKRRRKRRRERQGS